MQNYSVLATSFEQHFTRRHFPETPATLYDAAQYILQIGGKRVRPVAVLMGNELFSTIQPVAYEVGTAMELFHNFSLIHDDIMDQAPLRRGMATVHQQFGESTALLAGDVMLVVAYEYLSKCSPEILPSIIQLFNKTAREVCEGQQLDMDFEKSATVTLEAYEHMISLKTSVLLAASLQMGAIIGGADDADQQHLYGFGKNLGIAFQIQDDYLDAFGDPDKFGKQVGGDILANKKTFLMIHALETANTKQKASLEFQLNNQELDKVSKVLEIFKDCKVDEWANELKDKYYQRSLHHLNQIKVDQIRKEPLKQLAAYLLHREN